MLSVNVDVCKRTEGPNKRWMDCGKDDMDRKELTTEMATNRERNI